MFPAQKDVMPLQPPQGQSGGRECRGRPARACRRSSCRMSASCCEAGNGLGIIGPSASGKSSLSRLHGRRCGSRCAARCGSTAPRSINGCRRRSASMSAICRRMSNCSAGTVAQNIARFEREPSPEAIVAAAKTAGVHDLIVKLPEGYETQVGEQGSALSAGQAQRIALARALYGDPFLVVLDEPNSNLDSEGDEALARAVMSVRQRGGIAVVVAHRPSALEAVDLVLVMGSGRMQHPVGPKDRGAGEGAAAPGAAARARPATPASRPRKERRMTQRSAAQPRSAVTSWPAPSSSPFWCVGVGGWAATAQLSGALIAPGQIVVDSNVKKVQHPTGGIVGEVRVRDGDRVKAGDIVVRLDDTVTRANLAIVTKGLNELCGAQGAARSRARRRRERSRFRLQLLTTSDRSRRARHRAERTASCSNCAAPPAPARSPSCGSASASCMRRSRASPRSRTPRRARSS